jgi:hypothetical protein
MESLVSGEPALDLFVLVCPIIVGDEMNLQVSGNALIDEAQELEPLVMSVSLLARADDRSVKGVQLRQRALSFHGAHSRASLLPGDHA